MNKTDATRHEKEAKREVGQGKRWNKELIM